MDPLIFIWSPFVLSAFLYLLIGVERFRKHRAAKRKGVSHD